LKIGLDAAAALESDGLAVGVVHVPTVKPLDAATILDAAARAAVVVTVEEHSIIGGLGSAIAEVLAEAGFDRAKRFKRIGIPDVFPDEYGSQESLLERYGITAAHVAATMRNLWGSSVPRVQVHLEGA